MVGVNSMVGVNYIKQHAAAGSSPEAGPSLLFMNMGESARMTRLFVAV